MSYVQSWWGVLQSALLNLWEKFADYLPEIVGALVVLIVGLIVAGLLSKIVRKIIEAAKIDQLVGQTKVREEFKKVNVDFSIAKLIAWSVKWFVILATLIAVADILKIPQITQFLQQVALYIPNVVAAAVILTIGVVAGNIVREVVVKAVEASKLSDTAAHPVGALAKWAIVLFALGAALVQLRVAAELVQIFFTGLIAMLALAGGLAFGLGGKDKARQWLDRMDKEIGKNDTGSSY